MANRDNHYEAAFEEFLRRRCVPYVAVDEAKRSLLSDGASIKSLDFIVSSPGPTTRLVDVKGRRFPSGDVQKQYCYCLAQNHLAIALSEPLLPACDSAPRPAAKTGVHCPLVP